MSMSDRERSGSGEPLASPERPVLGEGEPTPWPTEFKDFSTYRVSFWALGPIPIGAVLTFTVDPEDGTESEAPAIVAVLCTSAERDDTGIWISCRYLGSDKDWGKKWGVSTFSRKRLRLHLCRQIEDCFAERGYHVTEFGFWPVGTFQAGYVEKRQKAFLDQFISDLRAGRNPLAHEEKEDGQEKGGSAAQKLAELRKKLVAAKTRPAGGDPKSVSFAALPPREGILKRRPPPKDVPELKVEGDCAVVLSSGSEGTARKRAKPSAVKKSVGSALYAAVEMQQSRGKGRASKRALAISDGEDPPKERGKKTKKKKKRKKKKKKHSSSDGSSSSSGGSSTSSSALKPPLQRKAELKPGSVLKLLMDHVRLSLSDVSLADPNDTGASAAVHSPAKVTSYFQILIRQHLGNRPRDEKELYALAVSLDALRSGDIEKVADLLAGRYLAVETAAFEGSWETARWLEVARLEERGAAPAEVLLAARRHQRTLDRVSGRGSFGGGSHGYWGAGQGGSGHWDDWAPMGKGKGKKGKKGKGKGKKSKAGKKGHEDNWWDNPGRDGVKETDPKKGDSQK